jgi:hypothetical protein
MFNRPQRRVRFGGLLHLHAVTIENFDATMTGMVLSSYFGAFALGAMRCSRILERMGYIRAYAALRAIVGFGCAGIFVTAESWLNAKARAVGAREGLFNLS